MQKIIFTILVITTFLSLKNVNAQEFKGGALIGIAGSQVYGDKLSGYNKPGFIGGFFVNRKIKKDFSWQMELKYIQKGSRKVLSDSIPAYFLHLNYVEVPLLLHWNYRNWFTLEGGPCIGVLVKQKEEDEYGPLAYRAFNKTEISWQFGATFKIYESLYFNMKTSNTVFFTPIRKHLSGQTFRFNLGQYNNLLEFTLRYQFKKAKSDEK